MKRSHYNKAALWGGQIFVLIEAALQIAIEACNHNYFWPHCVRTLPRAHFLAHPIANAVFNAAVLAFFDGENRRLYFVSPISAARVDILILFYGLCLTEAFLYGLIFGMGSKVLFFGSARLCFAIRRRC